MKREFTTRTLIVASVSLVLVAIVGLLYFTRSAGGERATPFGDAISVLEGEPGDVVAVVDGTEISSAQVQAYLILAAGPGPGPAQGVGAPFTEAEYVDLLINNELLYQEALRRGHGPTDDEVMALAVQVKDSLLEAMKANMQGLPRAYEPKHRSYGTCSSKWRARHTTWMSTIRAPKCWTASAARSRSMRCATRSSRRCRQQIGTTSISAKQPSTSSLRVCGVWQISPSSTHSFRLPSQLA